MSKAEKTKHPIRSGAAVAKRAQAVQTPDAQSIAIEALGLLGKWTKLAQRHLSAGGSCACSVDFGDIQVQDFEQQILDYLHNRHGAKPAMAAVMAEQGRYRKAESGSLSELLRAFAMQSAKVPAAESAELLGDLARSIDSIEELHRT
jgi:hypothetical protein